MEALFHVTPFVAASAVSTLFSAVWEGIVLAGCVVICLRMFPALSSAARSVVWMNVFALLVLLQVIPYFGAHVLAANAIRPAPFQLNPIWSFVVAGVWCLLSLLRGAQLIFSAIRLRALARRATPIDNADAALQALLQIRTVGAKVGRTAELCTSTEVERPSVFGFFRPRILIPPALMERLTARELQQVVVHEMEHLRRADDWTNLLQKMALVLFPLNPALLWVERRLCAERELACDDSVLRSSGGRKAYAICLTRLAEYSMLRRSFSLVLGAWERRSEVVRRVHRILRSPNDAGKLMSGRRTFVLTGSLIAAVMACAIGLARSPQLVSFAPSGPSEPSAQFTAQGPQLQGDLREANTERFGPEHSGAHALMVKAVMPQGAPESTSGTKPVRRMAVTRSAKRQNAVRQQAWIVMTGWSDMDMAPQLIFTVAQSTGTSRNQTPLNGASIDRTPLNQNGENRPRYAAIPLPNGWLIIQI
jgi:beta-lactamase regulating signal transducer with metallopeptidase domain